MKLKRVLKWLLGLFLVGVVLVVIFFLSLDTIFRLMVIRNIKAQTGMTAEIGQFHLGLREPVIFIKDLKLRNPASFGDSPLLVIPEIYVEYDREALKVNSEIHVTLLRFNLGEVDIVKNEAGKTNLFELGVTLPTKDDLAKSKDRDLIKLRKQYPALREGEVAWLKNSEGEQVLSLVRRDAKDEFLILINLSSRRVSGSVEYLAEEFQPVNIAGWSYPVDNHLPNFKLNGYGWMIAHRTVGK